MDWLAVVIGLLGTYLVGHHSLQGKQVGWVCWLIATSLWFWFGYVNGIHSLMLSSAGYFVFELIGLIKSQGRKL